MLERLRKSDRGFFRAILFNGCLFRLLDVLAQRKDSGEIHGSILIDGRPQGISFQRTTGYCEQQDVHEKTATVKEALVFSALLRQPATVSEEEKIAYVDHIINLLELDEISDALIGGKYQHFLVCSRCIPTDIPQYPGLA